MVSIAHQIACCIERARLESTDNGLSWPSPENEIYWHTREAAAIFGRKLGVSVPALVHALSEVSSIYTKRSIYLLSEPYWPDLAHPLLVVKEVMEI
jgi:hypothetical protein